MCPNLEMTEGQHCGWDVFVFCVYVGGLNKGLMNVEHRYPCSFVSHVSKFRNFMNNGDLYKQRPKFYKNNYLSEGFLTSNPKKNFLNCDNFLLTKFETPTELPLPPNLDNL